MLYHCDHLIDDNLNIRINDDIKRAVEELGMLQVGNSNTPLKDSKYKAFELK
jgi:hypothetical protein